jgi:hypothetical protein
MFTSKEKKLLRDGKFAGFDLSGNKVFVGENDWFYFKCEKTVKVKANNPNMDHRRTDVFFTTRFNKGEL